MFKPGNRKRYKPLKEKFYWSSVECRYMEDYAIPYSVDYGTGKGFRKNYHYSVRFFVSLQRGK